MGNSPTYTQGFDGKVLDAVGETGASVGIPSFQFDKITVGIDASSTDTGATFTMEGSPDGIIWGAVGSIGISGSISATQAVPDDGFTLYDIVYTSVLPFFRVNLSTYVDGTYDVYVFARV